MVATSFNYALRANSAQRLFAIGLMRSLLPRLIRRRAFSLYSSVMVQTASRQRAMQCAVGIAAAAAGNASGVSGPVGLTGEAARCYGVVRLQVAITAFTFAAAHKTPEVVDKVFEFYKQAWADAASYGGYEYLVRY